MEPKPNTMKKLLGVLLRLGRVSNLPTVWSNVLAALVLSGGEFDLRGVWMMLVATSMYVGGMLLNDAFDAEIDSRERPERPIPAGEIGRRTVFVIGFALLLGGIVGAATFGVAAFWAGLATAMLITLYNAWHKGNPLGPILMGLCRVGIYCTTSAAVADEIPVDVVWGAALLLGYVLGLTYLAKYEGRGGPRRLWPLAGLFAPLIYALPEIATSYVTRTIIGGFGAWAYFATQTARRRDGASIRKAVGALIAGIALLDALLIAVSGAPATALLAVLAFGLTLVFHRYVAGT